MNRCEDKSEFLKSDSSLFPVSGKKEITCGKQQDFQNNPESDLIFVCLKNFTILIASINWW
jgi:hypothetical protein